MYLMWSMSWLA
jgi:hypothetical protein